jgi:hypothetical protein
MRTIERLLNLVENENATKVLDITTIVLKISTCSTIEINTDAFSHFVVNKFDL